MIASKALFVSAIFVLLLQVQGQRWVSKCSERPVIKNFDISRYAGKWFDIYRYEDDFSYGCQCVNVNFKLNGDSIEMKKCCTRETTGNYCVDGSAAVSFPKLDSVEGGMNISYYGPTKQSNYIILSTDYENYSIVYNCEARDEKAEEWFFLLSRSNVLSADVKEKVENLVDQYFDRESSMFVIEGQGKKCSE